MSSDMFVILFWFGHNLCASYNFFKRSSCHLIGLEMTRQCRKQATKPSTHSYLFQTQKQKSLTKQRDLEMLNIDTALGLDCTGKLVKYHSYKRTEMEIFWQSNIQTIKLQYHICHNNIKINILLKKNAILQIPFVLLLY